MCEYKNDIFLKLFILYEYYTNLMIIYLYNNKSYYKSPCKNLIQNKMTKIFLKE